MPMARRKRRVGADQTRDLARGGLGAVHQFAHLHRHLGQGGQDHPVAIEVLEDRLDRRELLLIKQYAALETAMSSLQAQSSWLTSQLSSMNANAGDQ